MSEQDTVVTGLAYIGLPRSAAIAAHGVSAKDVDEFTVVESNAGRVPNR